MIQRFEFLEVTFKVVKKLFVWSRLGEEEGLENNCSLVKRFDSCFAFVIEIKIEFSISSFFYLPPL